MVIQSCSFSFLTKRKPRHRRNTKKERINLAAVYRATLTYHFLKSYVTNQQPSCIGLWLSKLLPLAYCQNSQCQRAGHSTYQVLLYNTSFSNFSTLSILTKKKLQFKVLISFNLKHSYHTH